jgi:hypothetical protein
MTPLRAGNFNRAAGRSAATAVAACARAAAVRLGVVLAVLMLLAPAAAAAQVLETDLDGDGIRDTIFSGTQNDLCLILSRTPHPEPLRLQQQAVRFVAADIDHDGDRDIIAVTRLPGLDIFVNLGRGQFRAIHNDAVRMWSTGACRLSAAAAQFVDDDASDSAAGSPVVRRPKMRAPAAVALARPATLALPSRLLSRGIDPRGPPPLFF